MASEIDKSEIFANNKSVNSTIHRILARFTGATQSKILKEARTAKQTCDRFRSATGEIPERIDAQWRRFFRELLLGEYLLDAGLFDAQYAPEIDGQTPDWYVPSRSLIVEVFTIERGGASDPTSRVDRNISKKIEKYGSLIGSKGYSLVLAVHGDFFSALDGDEFREFMNSGVPFRNRGELSGLLFFAEREDFVAVRRQPYSFEFFGNAMAIRHIMLPQLVTGA